MYDFLTYTMMFLHMFVGLILIGIILLQRGRGGGLAGAFGGMGGQSAFGTKAGDVFTKITIWLATIWIVLGCVCVLLASNSRSQSSKIKSFDSEVEKAADEKSAADKKADDLVLPPPPAKSDVKAADDAAAKDVKPGAAAESKKPDATEKPAEEKKNEAEEGAPESKAPAAEKPAEPAKEPAAEPAAEKAPAADKPE